MSDLVARPDVFVGGRRVPTRGGTGQPAVDPSTGVAFGSSVLASAADMMPGSRPPGRASTGGYGPAGRGRARGRAARGGRLSPAARRGRRRLLTREARLPAVVLRAGTRAQPHPAPALLRRPDRDRSGRGRSAPTGPTAASSCASRSASSARSRPGTGRSACPPSRSAQRSRPAARSCSSRRRRPRSPPICWPFTVNGQLCPDLVAEPFLPGCVGDVHGAPVGRVGRRLGSEPDEPGQRAAEDRLGLGLPRPSSRTAAISAAGVGHRPVGAEDHAVGAVPPDQRPDPVPVKVRQSRRPRPPTRGRWRGSPARA